MNDAREIALEAPMSDAEYRAYWAGQMRKAMEAGRLLQEVRNSGSLTDRQWRSLHIADNVLCDLAQSAADEAGLGERFFPGWDWATQPAVAEALREMEGDNG